MKHGDKRNYPPIHVWWKISEGGDGRVLTTTWSPTLAHAKAQYAQTRGIPIKAVGAEFKLKEG